MLKQSKPTHPHLVAMIKCLDAKRDERIRVADKRRELDLQTLRISAVAVRSQILSQYQQEVRESREQHLEQVGKQWYEIQHDRRSYAGGVPDYTIKFPTKRTQQLHNQIAYSTEVSVLAGVSKYVGFPAAPPMRPASLQEVEEDFAKMGVSRSRIFVGQKLIHGLAHEACATCNFLHSIPGVGSAEVRRCLTVQTSRRTVYRADALGKPSTSFTRTSTASAVLGTSDSANLKPIFFKPHPAAERASTRHFLDECEWTCLSSQSFHELTCGSSVTTWEQTSLRITSN